MSLQKLITNYAAYNAWANETLIRFLQTKGAESWYAEVPSSFNSIARTLNHILAVQEYWYSVVTETEHTSTRMRNAEPDAPELFAALTAHSGIVAETVSRFTEEELSRPILVESPWFTSRVPRYDYIMQAISHGIYHRGQIVTIGRALGFTDAPMTDYHFYNVARQEQPA